MKAALTANGGTVFYSLSTLGLALIPFTVVRTRMEARIVSDQALATENQIGAFGWVKVSEQAAAIGITAVPTPITDESSDLWFVHQNMLSNFRVDANGDGGTSGTGYSIDSKAMRKFEDGDQMLGIAEVDVTDGFGLEMVTIGRILIKLH